MYKRQVRVIAEPGGAAGSGRAGVELPLLAGRGAVDGRATAYVCQAYACELPVTDRAALATQLDALRATT